MNFLVLSYTSTSLENDMDHAYAYYKSCTMVLLLARGLAPLFSCTAKKLDIRSYGVPLFYIAYTKQLILFIFPYSGYVEMLYSSNPPSSPLLLDLSVDTSSLPVAGMPTEPLPEFGTSVFLKDTSSVVIVS
jgi:hypothetical protein